MHRLLLFTVNVFTETYILWLSTLQEKVAKLTDKLCLSVHDQKCVELVRIILFTQTACS